jgi:hypothetical protein
MLRIATVRSVVEHSVLRSAHMRVFVQANFCGFLARISSPPTSPHPAFIAVFVVNVARLWGL